MYALTSSCLLYSTHDSSKLFTPPFRVPEIILPNLNIVRLEEYENQHLLEVTVGAQSHATLGIKKTEERKRRTQGRKKTEERRKNKEVGSKRNARGKENGKRRITEERIKKWTTRGRAAERREKTEDTQEKKGDRREKKKRRSRQQQESKMKGN